MKTNSKKKKEMIRSFIPTIVVCVLLIICTAFAIFLSGFDWHSDQMLGGFGNVGTSAQIGGALSETDKPEDWDYFDDTVMVGDSITYGMASYGYLSFDHVFAKIGLHQGTALTSKCVYTSKTQGYSISDALKKTQPGKIYVTLGINAIYSYKSDWFYDNYRALLNKIKTASPDSIIIIQSIFPVTEQWAINNGKPNCHQYIAYANQKLSELAKEENCHFLHTYEALTDEYGFLQSQYSGDGIHLSRKGYEAVFNYILTHPVKGSGEFTAIGAIRPPAPQVSTTSQVTMPDLEDVSSGSSDTSSQGSQSAPDEQNQSSSDVSDSSGISSDSSSIPSSSQPEIGDTSSAPSASESENEGESDIETDAPTSEPSQPQTPETSSPEPTVSDINESTSSQTNTAN